MRTSSIKPTQCHSKMQESISYGIAELFWIFIALDEKYVVFVDREIDIVGVCRMEACMLMIVSMKTNHPKMKWVTMYLNAVNSPVTRKWMKKCCCESLYGRVEKIAR